jgi:MinD-like ATPase involved in chromosome partitioning or flagellar assembly
MGERVLLTDADMRHPRQHYLFNLNNSIGLSALLTGRAGREIVSRIHPQLRLFVLPAGLRPPNPQELLGRPVFEVVLTLLAEQYDLVSFLTRRRRQKLRMLKFWQYVPVPRSWLPGATTRCTQS